MCEREREREREREIVEGVWVERQTPPHAMCLPFSCVSELKDCEEFRYQFSALLRPLVKASTQLHPGGAGESICRGLLAWTAHPLG